jgi:uncharacterized alkaline shock family protein YloU
MRLFIRIAIFFYILVITIVGVSGLLLLAHLIDLKIYHDFLSFIYLDPHAGTIAGVVISMTLLLSLAFARIIYGRQEKERIISFNNPLGRVTISMSALEDLIRRLVLKTPQIKEIRPNITSTKKGLDVDIRLVLRSDANIPDLTADLQEVIRRKILDVIGAEERVNIRVHVIKISADPLKSDKSDIGNLEDEAVSHVPFRGYRA